MESLWKQVLFYELTPKKNWVVSNWASRQSIVTYFCFLRTSSKSSREEREIEEREDRLIENRNEIFRPHFPDWRRSLTSIIANKSWWIGRSKLIFAARETSSDAAAALVHYIYVKVSKSEIWKSIFIREAYSACGQTMNTDNWQIRLSTRLKNALKKVVVLVTKHAYMKNHWEIFFD